LPLSPRGQSTGKIDNSNVSKRGKCEGKSSAPIKRREGRRTWCLIWWSKTPADGRTACDTGLVLEALDFVVQKTPPGRMKRQRAYRLLASLSQDNDNFLFKP
jgi:hypothetical protein